MPKKKSDFLTKCEDVAVEMMRRELERAKNKFPEYPKDVIHGAGILAEESGETVRAALDYHYLDGSNSEIIKEAAQTGAMAIRLISNILNKNRY